ncbi:MAG: N-acetylmuramoyl-L-alanine amidase [Deferribacteraceae bacterium]|jgi:N-acetylmuramoyl-L-alanine amidase|nr:N-acetylmuramoyl-L-alanine amidase [Deferribacteraceae bacterium]
MKREIGLFVLFFLLFMQFCIILFPDSVCAADTYESLKAEYDIAESLNSPRKSYTSLGDRFYRVYASKPGAKNADISVLFAGKCYKRSYELYSDNADMELAMKYLRILYTNYNTEAAAEGYLEYAELFTMKRDLASAQFVLKQLKLRFPGTPQETAADSMLSDLNKMAHKSGGQTGATFTIPSVIINNPPSSVAEEPESAAEYNIRNAEPADEFSIYSEDSANIVNNPESNGKIVIKGIRNFSTDDYTRIVIDISQNTKIDYRWLKENPQQKMPPRLFIDIENSVVESRVPREIPIKDGLLKSVRWAYNRPEVTRVVLDFETVKEYTVFQLGSPSRIVIDVSGEGKRTAAPKILPLPGGTKQPQDKAGNMTISDVFGLKIRNIVIDPGHGGKDPGCTYFGQKEKDIALDISKTLRDLLKRSHPNITVYLTRETDIFIPLEERTAIANKYKADIFISVHVNAARNTVAQGVETYVLNVTNDKAALEVAAFENQATTKAMSDLQGILKDIMTNSKLEESLRLASSTQNNMVSTLKLSKKENMGVKQAPFYVLVGAKMPAILVEAGFLSNSSDAKKLAAPAYRQEMAKGIHKGLAEYISKYNK